MNECLAEWEAAHGYDRSTLHFKDESGTLQKLDVDSVMYILGSAGLNTDNWSCLTEGYQVYWYENDNRMILYNANTHEVEYPEEYPASIFTDNQSLFHIYNENHIQALKVDFSVSSVNVDTAKSQAITSSSSDDAIKAIVIGSNNATAGEVAAIKSSISAIQANSSIVKALGGNSGSVKVLSALSNTKQAGNATIYMESLCVNAGDEEADVILRSDGTLKTNVVYMSVATTANTSASELASVGKTIGENIYAIFANINEGALDEDVNILIDLSSAAALGQDIVIDCSKYSEWKAVKRFSGTFGSNDAAHPLVISGVNMTSGTGYEATTFFDGGSSKYFLTGFFASVTGKAVIKNCVFENLTFTKPANDYILEAAEASTKTNTRNTVGVIGGVIDGRADRKLSASEVSSIGLPSDTGVGAKKYADATSITVKGTVYDKLADYTEATGYSNSNFKINGKVYVCDSTNIKDANGVVIGYYNVWYEVEGTHKAEEFDVTIENVVVKDSVSIISAGCAGGLIGYVGSSATQGRAAGTLKITNCEVNATVKSEDMNSGDGYGAVGGLVGFFCRDVNVFANISGCKVNATLYGYKRIGGAFGSSSWNGSVADRIVFTGTNDFSGVKIHTYANTLGATALFNAGTIGSNYSKFPGSTQTTLADTLYIKNEGTIIYTTKDADGKAITPLRGSSETSTIGGTFTAK